jgi:hypothetical protein
MSLTQKSQPRVRRLIQILKSRRVQSLQVSVLAFILFVFSLLLTFSDAFYLILSRYTPRPEILPFPMLVPLIWIVFQVAMLEREAEREGQMPQALSVVRRAHLQEWILSRETMLRLFIEGSSHSEQWKSVASATPALVEWILSSQPDLHLDILAFSTETFLPVCLDAARAMVTQPEPKIQQVSIRILIRDTNADWLIPYLADPRADQQYAEELKVRFLHQQSNWSGLIVREFGRVLPTSKIRLEMRVYPLEPVFKGILINREIGLVGVYPLGTTSWRGMQVWDYLGHEATMVRISKSAESSFERASFGLFLKWFDSLWQSFSCSREA